jgi:hypothetical protein
MSKEIFGFDIEKCWDYENGFYLTSHPKRIPKLVAHYELYKKIITLPGAVVECGVFKGASLIRLLSFREMLESTYSRKIIGFDAFGKFPDQTEKDDAQFIQKFEGASGEGISREELSFALEKKGYENYELLKGDVMETIPDYLEKHPELKISFLHIDVDVYRPSKFILEQLFDRVVRGGLVVFDDYATVAGETRAVDEFIRDLDYTVEKLAISHIPCFIVKK